MSFFHFDADDFSYCWYWLWFLAFSVNGEFYDFFYKIGTSFFFFGFWLIRVKEIWTNFSCQNLFSVLYCHHFSIIFSRMFHGTVFQSHWRHFFILIILDSVFVIWMYSWYSFCFILWNGVDNLVAFAWKRCTIRKWFISPF